MTALAVVVVAVAVVTGVAVVVVGAVAITPYSCCLHYQRSGRPKKQQQ